MFNKIKFKKSLIFSVLFFTFFNFQNLYAASVVKVVSQKWDESAIQYQKRRLYIVFENTSDKDYYGNVIVYCGSNNDPFGTSQILSIFAKNTDGVWFDDEVFWGGDQSCNAVVTDVNGKKEDLGSFNLYADLDTDGDGVPNTTDTDDDGDGILDTVEIQNGTNPLSKDSDGDGVLDNVDPFPLDKGEWSDFDKDEIGDNADLDDDNDGVSDSEEVKLGSNPKDTDSDDDGILDGEELKLGSSLTNKDTDGDGLDDLKESQMGTDLLKQDTDGDGVSDSKDLFPLDPLNNADTDGDGIGDGTDTDDDNDGLLDTEEAKYGTLTTKADTDGDGLSDLKEIQIGTNPNKKDTDGDGVEDSKDAFPLDARYSKDSDGDGIPDEIDPIAGPNVTGVVGGGSGVIWTFSNNISTSSATTTPVVFTNASNTEYLALKSTSPTTESTDLALPNNLISSFTNYYKNLVNANSGDTPQSKKEDTDLDNISDFDEIMVYGSNPKIIDTDMDGIRDDVELKNLTSIVEADTDKDGFKDGDDKFPKDTFNGMKDDDLDGLITKVEAGSIFDPTTKYTYYVISDFWLYWLLKFWYLIILLIVTWWILHRHVKGKMEDKKVRAILARQREDRENALEKAKRKI